MSKEQNINFKSLFIFLIFFGVVLSAVTAPIIQKIYGYPTGENIYSFFWYVCHQYPTRSFWVLQHPFALCSRCTGGYTGISLAAFIFCYGAHSENDQLNQISRQRFFYGALFLLAGILDGLCQVLGLFDSGNIARFLSGLIGGIGVFLLLYPGKLNPVRFHPKEV